MLQSMRKLAHSWVVKGLMLFLIISFSIWGIGDIFRGNPLQKAVAKVGEYDIIVQTMNRLFDRALAQARQSVDPNLTAAQAKQMGLMDQALESEIQRLLIEQEIQRLGIAVPREAVLSLVAAEPTLRNKDGSFNKDKFRQILQQQNLSEAAFVAQGQQDMAKQTLLIGLSVAPPPSSTMVDALYKTQARKRVLDVVTIDPAKIADLPTPDEKTLRDYYEKNGQHFTAPEYRGVTMATLSVSALEKDIHITDDQARKEFETNAARYARGEQRDIQQIVLQDEARAKQIAVQARASGDLAATARANKETVVPLDRLEEKNLPADLGQPVFKLAANEVSEPIKTQLGWHVVQVRKITAAGKPDFDRIKDKLRDDMRRDAAIEAATRVVNLIDDDLAAGHSLEDIADAQRLRLIAVRAVDAKGLTPDGKAPAELPFKDMVLKTAFAQGAGETGPVEDDKDGNFVIVRTDSVTPAATKAFESVKPQVLAAWKEYTQFAKASELAQKAEAALREGKPAEKSADGRAVTFRASSPISQLGDKDAALPQQVTTMALQLDKGASTTVMADNKYYVVRVAKMLAPDETGQEARKAQIALKLKQTANGELLDGYLRHLREVFPVKVHQAQLDKLRTQQEQP